MRKILGILAALLIVSWSTGALAQDKKAEKKEKETTIRGEVVDVSCFLAHGKDGTGDGHKSCGEACAKAGGPLGILAKNGKLYVSVMPDDHSAGPNAKLMDHIAHEVEATGKIRSKNGVNGIMISELKMVSEEKK